MREQTNNVRFKRHLLAMVGTYVVVNALARYKAVERLVRRTAGIINLMVMKKWVFSPRDERHVISLYRLASFAV